MKTHVKALVVGGGAVGTSIAYHLARAGWEDVVLVERDELTSGSTWHSAGLLPYFNMSYATTHIHDYSIRFYKTLKEETGLDPGFFVVGNLRMAQTRERMDEYMLYASTAETCDVPYEWMTPAEIAERWPLVRTEDLAGAIYHPTDGYINPADVTQAMAKGARARGVTIERKWQVDGYAWTGAHWDVTLTKMVEKGGNLIPSDERVTVHAEHVVTATGNHSQRTAKLLGIKIPAIPVEHQYIITEPDPALVEYRKTMPEHPVLRDADAKWYVREERGGWMLGPYEYGAPARFEYAVPDSFRADLFPLDLERIEEEYMSMIHRIPSSETAGLKDDYNGPICYTPDGNPLLGPAPGLRNMWLAEGFSFGITAAGGAGKYLADLMVEGEAEIDMGSLDPRRYGAWMTTEYAARKNEEAYAHVYILHHPDEEREACRPLRTAPAYDRQKAAGAQFGQVNGWERPNYYGPVDAPDTFDHDARSFRRGAWWPYAEAEARAVRETAGLIDATAFTKHSVTGPGATAFLDRFTCNRLPRIGRINLTYALSVAGTVRTEYTIVRLGETDYYLISAGGDEIVVGLSKPDDGVFGAHGPRDRQGVGEVDPADPRQPVAGEAVEKRRGPRPRHGMLGEGGGVDQPGGFAHGAGLGLGVWPPGPAPERPRVVVEGIGRIHGAVIVRPLPAVDLAELRAGGLLTVVGGSGAQGAAGLALLVGVVEDVDVGVGFLVLARGIFGRHPRAVAAGVERAHVDLGLALDHEVGEILSRPAGGGDAEGEALGEPHVAQSGRGAQKRVAVGRVTDRAVVIILEPGGFRRRDPVDHGHVFLLDPLEVEREEVGAETVGDSIFEARRRAVFVGPEHPAAAFLADIPLGVGIAEHGVFGHCLAVFDKSGVGFGDDVLVLDGDGGDLDAEEFRGALGMVAGGGDDVFGVDRHPLVRRDEVAALLDHFRERHVPVGARPGIAVDLPLPLDRHAAGAGALGHRLGDVGGVYVAVGRVVDCASEVLGADQRPALGDLRRRHPFIGHVAGFGGGGLEHVLVHALPRLGHAQVADDEEAGIEARFLLQRLVEPDRVVVDVGRRVGHVEIGQKPRGVPGGAAREFVALDEHDILPARPREVIGDGSADSAAADDESLDVCLHGADSFPVSADLTGNGPQTSRPSDITSPESDFRQHSRAIVGSAGCAAPPTR